MPEDVSRKQLETLLELQDTDSRIRRLEHQLDHLPEQQWLDEVEQQATEVRHKGDAVRVDLDRVRSETSRLEGEVELLRTRRDAEHAKMYSGDISHARELQSLRAEIDSTERRISGHEDELLEIMERGELLTSTHNDLDQRGEELEGRRAELAEARDDAAQGLLAELAEAKVDRDREHEQLPDDLISRYETTRDKFHGLAVGLLAGGMCTACRIELPTAQASVLLDGPPLGTCPMCSRLLVLPE